MHSKPNPHRRVLLPNLLSGLRLLTAPILLYLAWSGRSRLFLVLLALSLLSDALDGFLARRFNWTSEFGTRLDSWGDCAIYMTVPLCAWRLCKSLPPGR